MPPISFTLMALRFRNRIRLFPGVYLNLGLRGVSLSAGVRGASLTAGSRGLYSNLGLPGTGLSFRSKLNSGNTSSKPTPRAVDTRTTFNVLLRLQDTGEVIIEGDDGTPLTQRQLKMMREKSGDFIRRWLEKEVAKLNASYETTVNIHCETPSPESPKWLLLPAFDEPPPEKPLPPKIGLTDRLLLRRRRLEADFEGELTTYELDHCNWMLRANEHLRRIDNLRALGERVSHGDMNAMEAIFGNILSTLPWPRETDVAFEIDDNRTRLNLDVDFPEIEDMPNRIAAVSSRGIRVNFKNRTEAQLRRDYARLAHGTIFRVAGEAFANLPTVSEVTVSGFTQRPDPQTGATVDVYILSAQIPRSDWEVINFANLKDVDPIEALGKFKVVRSLDRSGRLREIAPLN